MWNNEQEARQKIKDMVALYYHDFKESHETFIGGG